MQMTNNNQKTLIVIAGPNGSGKSSIVSECKIDIETGTIINPDNYARSIPGVAEEEKRYILAMEACETLRRQLLENDISFGFETVASRRDKLDFVKEAKKRGYFIDLIFVNAGSPEKCYERIENRVSMGGHGVPKEKVFQRYERVMGYLSEYLGVADHAVLLDNSGEHPMVVASKEDGIISITANGKKCEWVKKYLSSFITD